MNRSPIQQMVDRACGFDRLDHETEVRGDER